MRDQIRALYGFRCGYCGVREADAGSQLTVDHFQPRAHQGDDSELNLVYCCYACNSFKSNYWQPRDESRQLLHPQEADTTSHWEQTSEGLLRPLSPRGENHIAVLHLNRPELVQYRLQLLERQQEQEEYLKLLNEYQAQEALLTEVLQRLKELS